MTTPAGARTGAAALRIAVAAVGILALSGCTATPLTPVSAEPTPSAAAPTETPTPAPTPTETSEFGGSGATTEGATPAPTTSGTAAATESAAPSATTPTANVVKIGRDDYSVLDWEVTCSGLDGSPTIIGKAKTDDGTDYVMMLLVGTSGDLISFTFSGGPANGGHATKSGLTVTPASGQGTGTFLHEGDQVSSEGRGVSYGPYDKDLSVDTNYVVEFTCPVR